jgi:hypothetical protein
MLELPNCERDSLRSFINKLKPYGLNQQKASNIGVVKNVRSKTCLSISIRARRAFYSSQRRATSIRSKSTKS